MNRIASVCVRGGSKGVKGKNAMILDGIPLLAHTLKQIFDSNLFNFVAVSSDDNNLLKIASDYGCKEIVERPAEMATDTSPKLPVVKHCVKTIEDRHNLEMDLCVDFDATSPLRSIDDIKAVVSLCEEDDVTNVITGMPSRRSPYFNMVELNNNGVPGLSKNPKDNVSRRQDSPKCYDMNASIYAWKRDELFKNDSIFLDKTRLHVMPEERSIDIDTPIDLKFVEFIMNSKKSNEK